MRVCMIGSSRYPIGEPFAGGLEAHTHALARGLHRRGHEVSVFAAPGSDLDVPVTHLAVAPFTPSEARRAVARAISSESKWVMSRVVCCHAGQVASASLCSMSASTSAWMTLSRSPSSTWSRL